MSLILEAFDRMCESDLSINTPIEIEEFMNMSDLDYYNQLKITQEAVSKFRDDYEAIKAKENDWNYVDIIRDEERKFYRKYIDFVRKCRDMSTIVGVTGYGVDDSIRIKIMDLCRAVDYNFPYGWK